MHKLAKGYGKQEKRKREWEMGERDWEVGKRNWEGRDCKRKSDDAERETAPPNSEMGGGRRTDRSGHKVEGRGTRNTEPGRRKKERV